jgi:RNA polymerase sigma-70 factor, ECF subfamily
VLGDHLQGNMSNTVATRFDLHLPKEDTARTLAATVEATSLAARPDESLIKLIGTDNKDALGLLFRRYARVVRGVALRVLKDPSEADDLLQDIFILIHRLCGTFDSSKGSAQFWILQMTYRRAISRRRYLNSRHFYSHVELDEQSIQVAESGSG